jgi:signal transduction histidine kinase
MQERPMSSLAADQAFLAGLTVLYVEAGPMVRRQASRHLQPQVGRLFVAADGAEGLDLFRSVRPDLVITDLMMPRLDGLGFIEAVRSEAPHLPVIVTSALDQPSVFIQAIALGVNRYLLKPLHPDQLTAALLHCSNLVWRARVAETQLQGVDQRQAQLEAILQIFAEGIAHDYNNLLQALMLFVGLAKESRNDPDTVLDLLNTAESSWAEIRELGNRLRLLGRSTAAFEDTYSLESILGAAWDESVGGSNCRLALDFADFAEGLPTLRLDKVQIKMVIKILARNAIEAMGGSGTLHIAGKVRQVRSEDSLPLVPGAYLHLACTDQGPGIAPAILPILFSPYASTKERGVQRGMGLSLALARAIVNRHGGALLAENPAGGGAKLHLYLPLPSPGQSLATVPATRVMPLRLWPPSDGSVSARRNPPAVAETPTPSPDWILPGSISMIV